MIDGYHRILAIDPYGQSQLGPAATGLCEYLETGLPTLEHCVSSDRSGHSVVRGPGTAPAGEGSSLRMSQAEDTGLRSKRQQPDIAQ